MTGRDPSERTIAEQHQCWPIAATPTGIGEDVMDRRAPPLPGKGHITRILMPPSRPARKRIISGGADRQRQDHHRARRSSKWSSHAVRGSCSCSRIAARSSGKRATKNCTSLMSRTASSWPAPNCGRLRMCSSQPFRPCTGAPLAPNWSCRRPICWRSTRPTTVRLQPTARSSSSIRTRCCSA